MVISYMLSAAPLTVKSIMVAVNHRAMEKSIICFDKAKTMSFSAAPSKLFQSVLPFEDCCMTGTQFIVSNKFIAAQKGAFLRAKSKNMKSVNDD